VPPLSEETGFSYFLPAEAGYRELRVLFEYLMAEGLIQDLNVNQTNDEKNDKQSNGTSKAKVDVCVIDADDLLDHPQEIMEKFCQSVGLDYSPSMLEWGADQNCDAFDKWKGFHNDVLGSSGLKARPSVSILRLEGSSGHIFYKFPPLPPRFICSILTRNYRRRRNRRNKCIKIG